MSNISGQLIKDSYNYVLQSDLITGIVYRIGGSVAENPKFISGLTVNANFTYSNGSEFPGYVLTCDSAGNAIWGPVSGATSGVVVTGGTFDYSAGTLTLGLSNGVNVPISGLEDIYVTGGVVSGNSIVFSYNDTNTFEVSGITSFDTFTSYTASTEQILNSKVDINLFNSEVESLEIEIDNRVQIPAFTAYTAYTQTLILNSVTGGTYSGGTLYLVNNSGTTIPISGFTTGGTSTTDTFVTGFSLNSNVITLSQNRTDSYSSFTISLSAYTGSSVSGEYLPLSGGTVTGNTTFTSGLTVNYIDFDTTPNVPAPTGGTVYFDSNENALSYKPITPSNDVTVNLGQESLIRIYNNLGFQINNGQALHITGSTSDVPTVSLAVGAGGDEVQFQVSGIATHDIPDSSFGFMTVFGTVRDINLTGFTVGEQIYLSQTVPGGFASYSDLYFTGRTCEIGHVLDNSALGKLQVSILNEIEGFIITSQENNILAANNSSTGVFEFSGLSITAPSATTFNVSPVKAWIVDNTTNPVNPNVLFVNYSGGTNILATNVTTATETYILLTSAATITQQTTFPTAQQRRENIYLGKFGHGTRQYLINAFSEPDYVMSPISQLRDMFVPIRLINNGVIPSPNNANLTFNTSSGILYGLGINYINNVLNPNTLSVSGQSPTTFQYRTQTGGTATNRTTIDPENWDNNGVVTPIGGTKATNQRIYLLQNGQIRVQYGQREYSNIANAIAAVQSEPFITFPNFVDNGILIGVLSVLSSANVLNDTSKAQFFIVSKFGEVVGAAGGTSTTTLQQAYNNSATPEIVTNSAEGALSIQNGTVNADNVTNLFEGRGVSTGVLSGVTSFIRADGAISGTTFFGNGGNLSHIFNSVKINDTTQFSANTNTFINFSGINVTILSGANNTLIFSAGTGGTSSGTTDDTFVTGFSLTNDVLTLSQNTSSQYSGFSVNLSGYSPSITGATSVGSGTSIYDSTTDKVINIKSITSDTTNKVSVTSQNQTIELGVNEQNLTLWNLVVQGNKLLNGSVSYVSGLTFSVSPLEYLINGQIYTISTETTVTLTSGDSTFDRIDVIYADISGNTGVLQGVPSANPEKALVDGDTEVEVTFVLVRANSTSADVSTFVIYNENSGPPSEWTFGSGGVQPTRIIGNFTGVTYSGGTSIRVSGVTGAYTTFFRLTGLTELNTNNYSTLQFAIRNLSANTTTSLIRFRFLTTGGTQNGSVVTMNGAGTANVVQYSPTNVSTWQLISIPLWRFYLTNTNVQVLEVSFSPQGTGAQSRYYFDLLEFVEGTSSAPPSNSWTTIRGDSAATTITAPSPNATLILSGGTNISSSISGTSTVVFNLDNNINLNGVTATTISATTYQNLPIDIRVTGGTYSNGNTTFRNNTGGTFTVTGSTIYSSGILSGSSNWVSNGNGSVNLPTVQVALYNNSSYTEPVQVYTVSSGVTGSGGIAALTDNDTNYIYIEYNNGSPRWGVSTDNSFINGSDIDLCYLIYRANNFVHVLDFGNEGAGLPNKISNRIVAVNRFGRESGFSLGLSGATGVVTLTSGVAWNGTNRQSLVPVNSQDDIFFKNFHSGGTWVYTTTGDTINNTYYDDGTDIVLATASKYLVNWYFRGQEVNDHLYEVYGTDEYDSVAEAQLSVEPVLPELITSHAFLTGRIIVQVSATTGSVESAFVQVFQSTQVTQHNDLTSIQGGTAGEYYHLTASEYSNNAYTNVDNNFSVGQTISGGLIVDTISATTISGDTLYGNGSNLTNVPNIYNSDGVISEDRIVDVQGDSLYFSSSTHSNVLRYNSRYGIYVYNTENTDILFTADANDGSVTIYGNFNINSGDTYLNSLNVDNTVPYLLGLDGTNKVTKFDSTYVFNSITGGTYSGDTLYLVTNSGNTIEIGGFARSGSTSSFTGGTVSGPTNFTGGLTANTISATTYQNLPVSITSVTESANVITVVNSNGQSATNTIDAVTGGTYSAGQITLSGTGNVNGTQISTKILPVALTVVSSTASTDASLSSTFTLTLTGNTTLATPTNGFSGQRIIYRLTQDGTGNKLLTLSSGFRSGPITVTLSTAANTTDYLGVIYNEIDNEWDVLALNKGYS